MSEMSDEKGRVPSAPGRSAEPEPVNGLGPTGECPSRGPTNESTILSWLNEAATPGLWKAHGRYVTDFDGFGMVGGVHYAAISPTWLDANPDKHWGGYDESHRRVHPGEGIANAAFIVALVNAYRKGRLAPAFTPLAGREEVARIIANAVGKPLDPAKSPMGRLSDPLPKDWLRAADAILALISPAETLDRAEAAGAWRPAVLALKNCADAVDFYDRTQAATEAERAAVGADAWQWMMEACRRAAKVAPPLSTEEGAR